jgi:hypothetical protein
MKDATSAPPRNEARSSTRGLRAVFFDVENSSRPEHVAAILDHLGLVLASGVELIAMGNWRVVAPGTARLLAARGATLLHSAPAPGVKDWSDLRIAVAAGMWLGASRAGDVLEIVTDDQAFDAVGDVASCRGVTFRRISYRSLSGPGQIEPVPKSGRRRHRRRSGGRAPNRPRDRR